MIQAKDLTYGGISLSDIGEDFVLVDVGGGKSELNSQYLSTEVSRSPVHFGTPSTNFYTKTPSSVLKFSIAIAHESGAKMTTEDITALNSWLLAGKTPKVCSFTPYDDAEDTSVYSDVDYIGVFTNSAYSQVGQVGKISVEYDFENISAYAFSKIKRYTLRSTSATNPVKTTIVGGGSSGEVVTPKITITPTANGTVTIANDADSADPFSVTVTNGQTIIISDSNMFKEDGTLYDFDNAANLNFPMIADGINRISVTGLATVVFELRFYVSVGA